MQATKTRILTLLFSSLALQACGTGPNSDISPTSTDLMTRSDAVDHIATTACERADVCLQIGPDKKYPTQEDCVIEQRADFSKRWSAEMCGDPHAVIEGALASCETHVEQYTCSNSVFDLTGVLTECGEKDVCR